MTLYTIQMTINPSHNMILPPKAQISQLLLNRNYICRIALINCNYLGPASTINDRLINWRLSCRSVPPPVKTLRKNIARVRSCPDITILINLFGQDQSQGALGGHGGQGGWGGRGGRGGRGGQGGWCGQGVWVVRWLGSSRSSGWSG